MTSLSKSHRTIWPTHFAAFLNLHESETPTHFLAAFEPAAVQLSYDGVPTGQLTPGASTWAARSVGKPAEVSSPREDLCS